MIRLQIIETYIPSEVKIPIEEHFIEFKSETEIKSISCASQEEFVLNSSDNTVFEVSLYQSSKFISKISEGFSFLNTYHKHEVLDDWICFKIYSKYFKSSQPLGKVITKQLNFRVRILGARLLQRPLKKNPLPPQPHIGDFPDIESAEKINHQEKLDVDRAMLQEKSQTNFRRGRRNQTFISSDLIASSEASRKKTLNQYKPILPEILENEHSPIGSPPPVSLQANKGNRSPNALNIPEIPKTASQTNHRRPMVIKIEKNSRLTKEYECLSGELSRTYSVEDSCTPSTSFETHSFFFETPQGTHRKASADFSQDRSSTFVSNPESCLRSQRDELEITPKENELAALNSQLRRFPLPETLSACTYINYVSSIDFCYKSTQYIVNQLNHRLRYFGLPNESSDFHVFLVNMPLMSSYEPEAPLLLDPKHNFCALLSIIFKQKWSKALNDETGVNKELSDGQITACEKLEEAHKGFKKNFTKELSNIDQLIYEIECKIENQEELYQAKLEKNYELEDIKSNLQVELQELISKNREDDEYEGGCEDLFEEIEMYKEKIANYQSRSERASKSLEISLTEFSKKNDELTRESLSIILESERIEIEIENIESENQKQQRLLLLESSQTDYSLQSLTYSQFISDSQESINNLNSLGASTNTETVLLIHKIKKQNKVYKTQLKTLEASLEDHTKLISCATAKQNQPKHQLICKPQRSPSSNPNFLRKTNPLHTECDYITTQLFDLIADLKNLSISQQAIRKLLEIGSLQESLIKTIACEISPEYTFNSDPIDLALSTYLNLNIGVISLNIRKQSYGVYLFNDKSVNLMLRNSKLFVKSGGGFTPLRDFLNHFETVPKLKL